MDLLFDWIERLLPDVLVQHNRGCLAQMIAAARELSESANIIAVISSMLSHPERNAEIKILIGKDRDRPSVPTNPRQS